MIQVDQTALESVRRELLKGETVLWAGRPNKGVIFHREDAFLIPFSVMWGGFAIFWEGGVLGRFGTSDTHSVPGFFVLWGIPFVVIGQYFIWGRFLTVAWKKGKTFYAVTDRRVLVVQDAWKYRAASSYLDALPTLTLETGAGNIGTLRFNPQQSFMRNNSWSAWDGMRIEDVPVFLDIADVREVYQLIGELRFKGRNA
jgi:hypothetical protein